MRYCRYDNTYLCESVVDFYHRYSHSQPWRGGSLGIPGRKGAIAVGFCLTDMKDFILVANERVYLIYTGTRQRTR